MRRLQGEMIVSMFYDIRVDKIVMCSAAHRESHFWVNTCFDVTARSEMCHKLMCLQVSRSASSKLELLTNNNSLSNLREGVI